ncbi:ABC transporter ATP-binding protein, partial [Lacticaseibacillus paracasei]
PYTWRLLDAVLSSDDQRDQLLTLPGTPPGLLQSIKGYAFVPRNPYAMPIDSKKVLPLFQLSLTHFVRSWSLDPRTPHYHPPVTTQNL